jgi:hypothetical protein
MKTETELAEIVSSLPPNMFIRYDAMIQGWLVVEAKRDAPGVKVVTNGRTVEVAVEKALSVISPHHAA